MARRILTKGQVICIALLWVVLVVLFVMNKEMNFEAIFTIVASGLIILLAISKNT